MLDTSSLTVFDPDTVEVSNLLHRHDHPFQIDIPIGEDVLPVTFSLNEPDEVLHDTVMVSLATDFGTLQLLFAPECLELLCDLWLDGWRDETEDALPLEWRVVCLVHFLWQLTAFRDTGWTVLSVEQSVYPEVEPRVIKGSVIVGDTRFWAGLKIVAVDTKEFKSLFASVLQTSRPMPDLEWHVTVRLPLPELSMRETASLRRGDVVFATHSVKTSLNVRANVQGRSWSGILGLDGTFTANSIISGAFEMTEAAKNENEEAISIDAQMTDEAGQIHGPQTDDDNDNNQDSLDELPVKLEVIFKSAFLPLSQIRSLDAGVIVNLGVDLSDQVRVQANDKDVGRGRLVQIGDRIGLELTHWTLTADPSR